MHNLTGKGAEALIGVLRGYLMYQNVGFITCPRYGIPIKDLDTCRALNLSFHMDRPIREYAPFPFYYLHDGKLHA